MKLAARVLGLLKSVESATTPEIVRACFAGKSYPYSRAWKILGSLRDAGVVVREDRPGMRDSLGRPKNVVTWKLKRVPGYPEPVADAADRDYPAVDSRALRPAAVIS